VLSTRRDIGDLLNGQCLTFELKHWRLAIADCQLATS
jgi:hypothetical protein